MAKYMADIESSLTFGSGPRHVLQVKLRLGMITQKSCFEMFGLGITIADVVASWHAGFEMCNFNFHTKGTQRPVVTLAQLEGPVMA